MAVTPEQITAARNHGLNNAEAAAYAADQLSASYYQVCALLEKESGGRNVYGNDAGGTLSGFRDAVSEANWRAFRHEVLVRGMRSNGVGPCQITYKGFFVEMEQRGLKPWEPRDNILYGAGLYWSYFKAKRAEGYSVKSSIRWAGTFYNAGSNEDQIIPYGDRLFELATKWRNLVGVADTT